MPHSSGGGSHGGGFHYSGGGSHHSSSSSSSSYSSTPSSATISRKPQDGYYKYIYYGRRGRPTYYYASSSTFEADPIVTGIVCVILTFVAGCILYFLIGIGYYNPRPLDIQSYNSNIVLEDHTGLIDESVLDSGMHLMRKTTGVTPGLEVVYDDEWEGKYTDLETFALSEYLRLYDDEKHWLVVLSYPSDYATSEFVDWSWEGMIGDDCYPACNSDSEALFTKTMQKHILRSSPEDVSSNINNAYKEFSSICMDTQISYGCLLFAAFIFIIYISLIYYFIMDYIRQKRLESSYFITKNAKEYNCEYCGSMYVAGTVSTCPNCGAPIPAHNQ